MPGSVATASGSSRMSDLTCLTEREYAEVLGALQIVRDNARAQGREPVDVISAYEKLSAGCKPNTVGMRFELLHAGENVAPERIA
jgi:hypothetical protein